MKERQILRELSSLLNVGYEDIPRTLERFRKEIGDMEKDMSS